MNKHLRMLGILYTHLGAFHLFGLLSGLILNNFFASTSGSTEFTVIRDILAVVFGIVALLSLIGGIALLKKQRWAERLLIVLGFILLIVIPYGTLLGIYSIWVLMIRDEGASELKTA